MSFLNPISHYSYLITHIPLLTSHYSYLITYIPKYRNRISTLLEASPLFLH